MTNPPDTDTSRTQDRRAAWIAAAALALVTAFYVLRGMPWCNGDEFAWIDAGIDLARTGRLTAHAYDGWLAGFGTDKFYIQPPFGAYSLALWVLAFGSSAKGFLVFHWLWYAAGIYGFERVLARFRLPLGLRLLMALVYLDVMVDKGFRPEAETFGLLFLGLALLDTAAPFWRRMLGLVFLGCSVLTYPISLMLAVPMGVALLCLPGENPEASAVARWREIFRAWLPAGLLSVAVVAGLFLAMIHGEVREFLTVLDAHRRLRVATGDHLGSFLHFITRYREAYFTLPPVLLLVAATAYVAARWRQIGRPARLWTLACAAAATGTVLMYVVKGSEIVPFLGFAAACGLVGSPELRRYRWRLASVIAGMWLWTQSLWIVSATLRHSPDPAHLALAREQALQSGKRVVVDSSTARYVFDYGLPEGARHADYLASPNDQPLARAESRARDFWVVIPATLEAGGLALPPGASEPHITIAHHEFHSAPVCPDDPLAIPPGTIAPR